MKLYADTPARRTRQILGDLWVLVWSAISIWLATVVFDVTMKLAVPGRMIEGAGSTMGEKLRDAGNSADNVPMVGDKLAKPFEGAGGAADTLADAGRTQAEAVHTFAWWLAIAVAIVPIIMVLSLYIPLRLRFIRRASTHVRLRDTEAGIDLLALRAITTQPLTVLDDISDDPAGDWRRGHVPVIRALAAVELRDSGLKPSAVITPRGPGYG
ncbi:hypothetical protein GOARA_021_00250 [Gordonia araii NBRC 100433]|uniref:Transmembrane protein n=1 Tax=Gordonia araii NBRC 100433 TaxID=1073574 RepID=G7GYW3_9ACTN|nr:hypothetical protein [Gordonia araii]NNG96998.1 hypothetical protein [Gordonia araii NBRC 100433]GAB08788.1 hypothetical protein GOARA_021_00250 [Gordonia araii NBRC 100433]